MASFNELGLKKELVEAISELGFETPTPIQEKAIPILLESDKDVIGLAQTGTGKTAAFGLPSLHRVDTSKSYPQSLILCPTRELCLQISKDLMSYGKYMKKVNIVAVYGGASIQGQIKELKRGAHIVVGTPGRTKDLINRKRLHLDQIDYLILDEADEMLSMGFKEDLEDIMSSTPADKQTLLFSATMSKEISRVTKKYMGETAEISVAKVNVGAKNVKHVFYMVAARNRFEVVQRIADANPQIYGIVFCRTRRETKEVANKLMTGGYSADALHGDLTQAQRDEVMQKFKDKNIQLLVATDVASRGLDVNNLTHVINYNLPDMTEAYTHRSGRTGRAGKSGTSIAIIHSREKRKIQNIERSSGIRFEQALVPTGKEICQKQLFALIDKIQNVEVDEAQIEPFLEQIYQKFEGLSREELIKHFVSAEFNRFLSYYKDSADLNIAERSRGDKHKDRGRNNVEFTRLYFNIGSKNKINPARLMGIINEALGSGKAKIGKIEILKKFSFIEVESGSELKIMQKLNKAEFEGKILSVEIAAPNPVPASKRTKTKKFKMRKVNRRRDGRPPKKSKRRKDR